MISHEYYSFNTIAFFQAQYFCWKNGPLSLINEKSSKISVDIVFNLTRDLVLTISMYSKKSYWIKGLSLKDSKKDAGYSKVSGAYQLRGPITANLHMATM